MAKAFAARHSLVLAPARVPHATIDRHLFSDLNQSFLQGSSRYQLDELFYAVRHHFVVPKPALTMSVEAQRGYQRATVESARDPLVWELAIKTAILSEAQPPSIEMTHAAVPTLVAYDTYPRPEDMASARVVDVHVPSRNSKGIAARTCLTFNPSSRSKVSKTNCQDDTVIVSENEARAGLPALLHALVARRAGDEKLLCLSSARMRTLLSKAVDALELPKTTPHQLRHGGASHDGATGITLDKIQQRGQWVAQSSCRRYAKPGRYLRLLAQVTPQEREVLSVGLGALLTRLTAKLAKVL